MKARTLVQVTPLAVGLAAGFVGLHFFQPEVRANEGMRRFDRLTVQNLTREHWAVVDELASFPAGRRRIVAGLTGLNRWHFHVEASGWGLGPEWRSALQRTDVPRLLDLLAEAEARNAFVRLPVPETARSWAWREDGSASVVHGPLRVEALFYPTSTGCVVAAYQNQSLIWSVSMRGIGLVSHSKYRNEVQLSVVDGLLVVCGDESAGRYVEVLVPETGRRVWHQLITP